MAMRHIGVPEAALRALRGLVDNWKHGVAQGRYETAFGATDPFPILRGFLQGAQGSPEACKIMMDTIAQALELKVSGYSAFAPDGAGLEVGMLVFVDDAANVTGDADFLQRVTVFWSIWSRITDCQLNIKGKDKTVVQALEYKRASNGTLTPTDTIKQFFIAGLQPNDPPRLIPNLLISEHYLYCGGIAELANLCDEVHGDFLGIDDILEAHPRAVELGARDARRELAALLGAITACHVAPVPGRRGWAMADAADGIIPPYVSAEYGLVRQVPLADLAQHKRSGDGGHQLAALLRVTVDDKILRAAIQLLPDNAAISFTDAQHGLSFHRSIDRELMKYHLRKYTELAPAVLHNLPGGSSSAAVDKFWSACLYAKSVAIILIGDSTDTPSAEAREVLDDMREQGVDWLAWLHARPEDSRELAPDPEASDEGAHSQSSDNLSPEKVRAALLLERRDALRADEEAVQRVDLELRELLERGGDPEVVRRFRQWMHEDEPPTSPSRSHAEDEPGQRGSSPQRFSLEPDDIYARAKVLLSAIENGASCESWLRRQPPGHLRSSSVLSDIWISPTTAFNLAAFAREQEARARWLARTRPHLISFVEALNGLMQEGDRDAELTAKSYVLQDYEGASRRAKVEWARRTQAQVVNLQHDGVRMRFPFNVSLDTATQQISAACSSALGYKQNELKVKECRFVFDKLLVLESEYPVSHFVATDGSKVVDPDSGNKMVSRACVAVAAEALGRIVLGGQLDVYADTFERHSYEAELAAFHDQLAATVDGMR
eukprot:jgi/Chrpa1/4590/Chrysochromulina_OHIO_Genome00017854-RA